MPGFSHHPATALGLAGTSGTRGLLGGVLGPTRVFPLHLLPIVCMQCGCEGGDAVGKVEAGEPGPWLTLGIQATMEAQIVIVSITDECDHLTHGGKLGQAPNTFQTRPGLAPQSLTASLSE